MRTHLVYYRQKIEGRNFGSDIDIPVQIDGTIRIVQCYLTVKSTPLIFSVQRDIFIPVSTIIY